MNDYKKRSPFRILSFRWLLLVDAICICGAVMSYGLIAWLFLDLETNALSMIWMIPPMLAETGVITAVTLRAVRKRMEKLLDGIRRVAGGDLDVELDTKGADEYKTIYENFNRMVRELKATKEEMQSFTNDFSHEFKTPITSISGFAAYLIRTGAGVETAERMEYLQLIRDESLRLSELAQSTLLLSKVEACQIITDRQKFSLSEQIKRCVILLLPQIEKKGVELDVDMPEIAYSGNPELLEQVWLNLLNNALKFTPSGGQITLRGVETQTEVQVCVRDTGSGMDEETVRHIFEKYYQNDTLHTVRGNGIGLAIVARIVTLCGGHVEVESAPEKGSAFTVHLPK